MGPEVGGRRFGGDELGMVGDGVREAGQYCSNKDSVGEWHGG